ncbi:MAG TPA: hypothetical protein VFC26_08995 [Verrucomicrobiae bacterium]|nr:hypothetical protein [Verrucomicrobiae bacterium]
MGKLTHIPAFLFTCFLALTASAQPIKIWDGGASGNWSNGNNWQDGSPPSGGEQLRFPEDASRFAMTNNIPNLTVHSITFTDPGSDGYVLRGNAVRILGNNIVAGGVQASPQGSSNTR